MRRAPLLVLVVLAASLVALPVGAHASPAAKAFAVGCWKGHGVGDIVGISSPAPGITLNVDRSGYTFDLAATSTIVAGKLELDGHGTATATASGVSATADITVSGDLDITGTRSHPAINGTVNLSGNVAVAGTTIPINFDEPVSSVPMTIKTAKPKKVTGRAGKSTWTAARVGASCS
jgi:hypothetical protein